MHTNSCLANYNIGKTKEEPWELEFSTSYCRNGSGQPCFLLPKVRNNFCGWKIIIFHVLQGNELDEETEDADDEEVVDDDVKDGEEHDMYVMSDEFL